MLHRMSHPRRQQLRRLLRASMRACGAASALVAGLLSAGAGNGALACALALAAGGLVLAGRHELRLARRYRVGAQSEAAVRRSLEVLAREGWRVRHALGWPGGGDLDHVVCAPSGVAFVIETKTRRYSPAHVERTVRAARRLARRWRRRPRGVHAVLCITRARGLDRANDDLLLVSLDRLVPALRRVATSAPGHDGRERGSGVAARLSDRSSDRVGRRGGVSPLSGECDRSLQSSMPDPAERVTRRRAR
jgi:Nuclease-related domain